MPQPLNTIRSTWRSSALRHFEAAELGGGLFDRKPSPHGVAHGVRLLEDLLEHVVRELSLVHVLRHELDLADLEARIGTRKRGNIEAIRPEGDDFVIVEIDRLARVRDDGANVAGKEMLAFPNAEHERAPAPRADKHAGNIRMNDGDAVGADDLPQRFPHGLDERGLGLLVAPFEGCTYQVGEHLGVRLGLKNMALLLELRPKRGGSFR